MTETEREQVEKDVIYAAERTRRDYELQRAKLAAMGEKLEDLGRALQIHPELVTPLPEIDAPDYREALNLLNSRQEVIDLCRETRTLKDRQRAAAERKANLGFLGAVEK